VISADNAAAVNLLTRIQGNILPALDISPDGTLLAAAGNVGSDSVHLYQTNALDTVPRYIDQDETLLSLDMHPNGTQVLVGTRDGGAHLWNLAADATLTEALYLQTHISDVRSVQVAPAGTEFASAGIDAQVASASVDRAHALLLWDIASLSQTAILDDPGDAVLALDFAPAGNALAAVDAGGALYLWSLSAPDTPLTFLDAGASAVAYSPNGQFLAVGHTDGSIDLRNPTTGDVIATYTGHLGLITDVQFSPDNTLLASGSGDGTLRLWNTQSDSNLNVIEVSEDGVLDVAFAPDGRFIAAATEGSQIDVFGVRQGN
jgi:WD40 repeat protein